MDERFFLYCEETDLCLRIKQAGWEIRHLPYVTILHHENKAGWNPRLDAQAAYAKRQYLRKHLSPLHRLAATAGLVLGYSLRSAFGGGGPRRRERRSCRAGDALRAAAAAVRRAVAGGANVRAPVLSGGLPQVQNARH